MKRRDFLKITGIVGTGSLLLEGCIQTGKKTVPLLVGDDVPIPGAEDWMTSVCLQCPGGCGITVRIMEGKAKKIEGNPLYPINQGKLCARGQAGLQVLYNPDRIKKPMKRFGPRGGNPQWTEITWDEAIKTVVERLAALRQNNEPHTLMFLTGKLRGHMDTLVSRFMTAFGSPNHVSYELFSDEAVLKANLLTMGQEAFAAYDLENTNYLLSLGTAYLETSRSPVRFNLGYGHMRQGRPTIRSKIIQMEPRFSLTAANADEWVPIKPGTEGALALAIAHVIVQDGLYDKDFIAGSTAGFEEFKDFVLEQHPPDKAAAITGVAADRIKRIAKEFATIRPSVALGGDAAAAHTNGLFAMAAINALNALVGSIGRPGGLFFDPAPGFAKLPDMSKDPVAEKGLAMPRLDRIDGASSLWPGLSHSLPERLFSGNPYSAKMLFLYEANPVFSMPAATQIRAALEKIPFIVSFSSFLDETSSLADLMLPESTFLERWQDDVPAPGLGIPTVGIIRPVVKPLYDTKSAGDALLNIAKQLGGTVAQALPWESFLDMLKAAYQGIYQQKKGSVTAEDFNGFWEKLLEKGGWWDADYKKEAELRTPSKKFEFNPNGLWRRYELARFEGDEKEYPFFLNVYQSLSLSDGRGANQPWLQEMPDPMTSISWNAWVELNPKTAQQLGVKDDDLVWLESVHGKIKLPVHIFPGAMPDVVNVPVGQGHETYGRYAKDRGANPLKVVTKWTEPTSGTPAWAATRVKIHKAGGAQRLSKIGYDRMHTEAERKRPA